EAVIAASASALNIISGNNQSGTAGSTLATRLVVQVTDVYGNSVSGTPVTFGDNSSGGNFSTNPIGSNTSGLASVSYTLPTVAGSVMVAGVAVTFDDGGANGSFSGDPIITDDSGTASVVYTTPAVSGSISITASVPSVTPVVFNETAQ